MSDVKLCNKHGGMFATDDDGWAKFTGEIHHMGENEYGAEQEFVEHVTWHFCGNCVSEMRVAGKANRRQQYIAELEKENHIPPLPIPVAGCPHNPPCMNAALCLSQRTAAGDLFTGDTE